MPGTLPSNLVVHNVQSVSSADNQSVAMMLKYIGPRTYDVSGTATAVDINVIHTAFDFLFYLDHANTRLDDTTYSADGVGITDGTNEGRINTDVGAANYTFSDFAARVNASTNWRCTLVGALPTDNLYTHSGTVQHTVDIADGTNSTNVDTETGCLVYFDCDTDNKATAAIGLESAGATFGTFLTRHSWRTTTDATRDIDDLGDGEYQPLDRVNYLISVFATGTFSAGSATLSIYAVDSDENVRTLYSEAGGLNDAEHSYEPGHVIQTRPGERLVVQYVAGTTTTAAIITINGGWGVTRV